MFLMKLSTAATIEVGPALDSAGAEYTGLVIGDLRLVKAGTGAAMAASATLTHVANGHYTLVFTTGNTDTLGTLTVSCHKSTYQMPRVLMQVIPVKVYDSIVSGSDNLEVDAIQLLGTAIATPATAGLMDVNAKQFGGATVTASTSVTIPTSSTLATTTGAVGSVTGNVGGNVTGSVASVVGNVGGNVTGSVASVVGAVGSVTGLTVANLDTTVSSRMATYAQPTGFLAATFPVTVASPTNITAITGNITGNLSGSVGSVTAVSTGAITTASFAAGAIDAAAIATDAIGSAEISAAAVTKIQSGLATPTNITAATGITVSSIGANVITASALATDAVNEIQSGLATPTNITAITGNITGNLSGSVGSVTDAVTVGTISPDVITASALDASAVNEIADQVWDELLSGHTVSGSTGAGLSAAGAAGDPWSTALPGSYGAGTAGKIVGDNVNATISSRASQTSLDTLDDYVDSEIGSIKTKTDQLTFTVANQVDANTLTGGGSGLTAAQTRSALGMATANLDTQIATLATPTNITAATGITVSSIGANVVTAAALASDAVNEIADQVWDEVLLSHTVSGSTGAGLSAAVAAGDPWSTTLPGSYGAGTAGKIVGDNVNATISSRASQTSLDTVPTAAQNFAAVLTTALTESYAADGAAPTLAQAIMLIQQSLHEFAISSTTRTVKKLDGSTTAATFTLDSATAPTSTTRAT